MAVIYNTPKSIIYDNLVFHIDPPNKQHCIAEGDRTDPLTNGDVKDMTGNLSNTINVNDSSDSPSGDGYKPQWHTDSDVLGYIRYHSNGAGTGNYYYNLYKDDPTSNASASVQFDIAYGDENGSGSVWFNSKFWNQFSLGGGMDI